MSENTDNLFSTVYIITNNTSSGFKDLVVWKCIMLIMLLWTQYLSDWAGLLGSVKRDGWDSATDSTCVQLPICAATCMTEDTIKPFPHKFDIDVFAVTSRIELYQKVIKYI